MRAEYGIAVIIVAVAVTAIIVHGLVSQPEPVAEEPKAGLGISHYDLSNLTVQGEATFTAARIINTGNLPLNITIVWQPNGSNLSVSVEPETILLQPEESAKIYITVHSEPSDHGTHRGSVSIQAVTNTPESGNRVVSGGSVDATIHVSSAD